MRVGILVAAAAIMIGATSMVEMPGVESDGRPEIGWTESAPASRGDAVALVALSSRLLPRSSVIQVAAVSRGGVTIILTPPQQRILLSSGGAALGAGIGAAACSAGGPAAAACAAGGAFLAVAAAEAIKEYGVREGCDLYVTFNNGRNPTVTNVSRMCGSKKRLGTLPKAVPVP